METWSLDYQISAKDQNCHPMNDEFLITTGRVLTMEDTRSSNIMQGQLATIHLRIYIQQRLAQMLPIPAIALIDFYQQNCTRMTFTWPSGVEESFTCSEQEDGMVQISLVKISGLHTHDAFVQLTRQELGMIAKRCQRLPEESTRPCKVQIERA